MLEFNDCPRLAVVLNYQTWSEVRSRGHKIKDR
jgi:hypothetical protein